ncbi:MAG: ATP-dependent helicase [Vampirovibrio sp.]|nr:ATP-dependent helicase [Vampirovibrio sp.]
MTKPPTPTDAQKAIIESEDPYIHVEAGPGTGKTFTLLHRIKWLVENKKLAPTQKILFVTFTNALTNANRRSLLELGEDYQQYVSISTIDAFLFKIVRDLGDSDQVKAAENFETDGATKTFNDILDTLPEPYLKLIAKRYPYMLVDEVQDVFINTPKGNFINKLSETNCHITIVGNSSQEVMNFQNNLPLVFPKAISMKLSVSFRHEIKVKNNYAQYTPDDIDQHIQTEKTLHSQEVLLQKFHTLFNSNTKKLQSFFIIHNTDRANSFRNRNQQIEKMLNKQQLPYVILQSEFLGQLSLPQAVIESLYLKQKKKKKKNDDGLEKLPSLLQTFKNNLKTDVSFTLFCSRYFNSLLKSQTFQQFQEDAWVKDLNENATQVKYLMDFFTQHTHLHAIPMRQFHKKIIVSTVHSVKGLEADVVFLLGTPTGNLNYVAKTRHKKLFYHYPDRRASFS